MLRDFRLTTTESEAGSFLISYWRVDPGEAVNEGEELVVVESVDEKTALAVLSPWTGVLAEIAVGEGNEVAPGDLLGRIEAA